MVITPCFVNWFVVWQALQNRLPSLFQSNVFHRSFPLMCCVRNKKLPLHRNPPVQGQITIYLWCHLACRNYKLRPLCREPTFPCPVTGAARQRILKALAFFPRALREPLCCPALRPIPSNRGSLWLRCQLYFRFIGLKHLYHTVPVLSTAFCKKLFKNWYLLLHSSLYRPLSRAGSAAWRPTPLPGCRCFP